MRARDVIAERVADGWLPTTRFLGLWRAGGGLQTLPARLVLAGQDRRPTAVFLAVFRSAFGKGLNPLEAVVNRDGTPTDTFFNAATDAGL